MNNPFTHKLKAAENRLTELKQKQARFNENAMPGVFVTGRDGVPASRFRQLDRQLDRTIEFAKNIVATEQEVRDLSTKTRLFDEGKIDAQGRRLIDKAARARHEELYAAFIRSRVKAGDTAEFTIRAGGATCKVVRLNKKTVTLSSGTNWPYTAIAPLSTDGHILSEQELNTAFREFQNVLDTQAATATAGCEGGAR